MKVNKAEVLFKKIKSFNIFSVHLMVLRKDGNDFPESYNYGFWHLNNNQAAALCWSDFEEIPHVQSQRSPSKMVGGANSYLESNPIPTRDTQRAQTNLEHTRT